ncbi:MAG: tRNA threonylcarbamoyladenosine dehydratase, partial [Clostridia bacterium]|nr:tRNA threonylcarbamoyladenosine dehydratase [Clostridia bacterium]
KTSVCPLAKVMRIECRKRKIRKYRVLWSDEVPMTPLPTKETPAEGRRAIPASTAFVPPAAGLLLARTCVMELLGK